MPARWRAGARSGGAPRRRPGQVQLLTRSGNTANPDETWSAWSKPYSSAEGEQIASPNARYLQWRAVLTADSAPSPVLTSVTAAYLPRNLRPEVATITVHPAGHGLSAPVLRQRDRDRRVRREHLGRPPAGAGVRRARAASPPPPPPLGRRIYQKGLQTIVWKAEDANGDRLQYDVSYRREGETAWKVAEARDVGRRSSCGTRRRFLMAPTSSASPPPTRRRMPRRRRWPATWRARASISTTPRRASKRSPPRARARARRITFTVRDDQSPVQRVEYSLDASRWRMVYPKDGIPDSRREEFEVAVDDSEAGPQRHHPRHRCDEQRRDGRRDAAALTRRDALACRRQT